MRWATRPRNWLLLVAISTLVLSSACYRYWIQYDTDPGVVPAVGGQFHFEIWQAKEPNPKYFGKPVSETKDTSHQSLLLYVSFRPFSEDTTICVSVNSISSIPAEYIDTTRLKRSYLDTTRSYGYGRFVSIFPILIPLYNSEALSVSFRAVVSSTMNPSFDHEYMFTVVIRPSKDKKLRIVDILEGS